MNERIKELYNRSIVLEGNGDYTAGELDPVKFAELIVKECAELADKAKELDLDYIGDYVKGHFGVE